MSTSAETSMTARRGPWRWAVALVATVMLVVSGSGLVVFAQSGAGESQGPQFVPAGSSIYVEARLDMPAGQDEALAQMMTAFPGFADAGSFQMKIDEVMTGLGSQMGLDLPAGDLFGDVLTGEIGLAAGDFEAAMMGEDPAMIIGLAVADQDAAASLFDSLIGSGGTETTEEMYNDVAIVSDPSTSAAITDGWLLLSNDPAQVMASIDVLAGDAESLADDQDFSAAWSQLPTSRLGAAYMDFAPFTGFMDLAGMMAEGQTGMALPTADLAALLPQDMVMSLVAEDDRMTLTAAVTPGEMTPSLAVGESDMASLFPADTQVYFEMRELGAMVESGLNALVDFMAAAEMPADDPSGAMGAAAQIEVLLGENSPLAVQLEATLPEFLDFVEDAGIGVGLSSDGLWLGIAGEVTDEALAQERVDNLMRMITTFTMMMEDQGVSVGTDLVGDVEVSTITLPIDQMLAGSGVPLAMGNTISVAVSDGALLIGLGDFVQAALAADGADSLATSPGYVDAIGEDTPNTGVMYMNISSLLTALDPMLATMSPDWAQVAPYAEGLDRMVVVSTADDGGPGARISVIVDG